MRVSDAKRVLITGATGFVGSHIADYIAENYPDTEIFALRRWHLSQMRNLLHLQDRITLLDCDLTDPISTEDTITIARPDIIFHCAAQSFVSPSWRHPSLYMDVNYKGTVNLLEAVRKKCPDTFIHLPGSGEEYGKVEEDELPITPDSKISPVNPYAVSKVAQDLIGLVYHESYGMNIIRTRAFNHEGPRRMNVFGLPWYAYQIARIKDGLQPPSLNTGVTSDLRNFTHVSDMVRAYILAVEKCEPGRLYIIGNNLSSHEQTFSACLQKMLQFAGLQDKVSIRQVDDYTRPTQVPRLIADCSDFNNISGWKIEKSMDQILADTLDYWQKHHGDFPAWKVISPIAPN